MPIPKRPHLVEMGYRVAGVHDSHESIEDFPDTPHGRQCAIDLAKSLCRSRQERDRLCAEGRIDDPESILVVQRFQTEIDVLGLFSPQEFPDFHRFGHLPGNSDPSAMADVLSTQGVWTCLRLPNEQPVTDDVANRIAQLQPLVQALEIAVQAAAGGQSLPSLADHSRCCSEFDDLFRRLYEVGQQRTASHDGPADFVAALCDYDPVFANEVAAELDAARRRITDAVTVAYQALARELPEVQRDQAAADLRAFIYEVVLAGLLDESVVQ